MALIKYKLGSLITQSELRNSDNAYTVESVVGLPIVISITQGFTSILKAKS